MNKSIDFRTGFELFGKFLGADIRSLNSKVVHYMIDLSLYKNLKSDNDTTVIWKEKDRVLTLGYGCTYAVNGSPFEYFNIVLDDKYAHVSFIENWLDLHLDPNFVIPIVPPLICCKESYTIDLPAYIQNDPSGESITFTIDAVYDEKYSHKIVVIPTGNKKIMLISTGDKSSTRLRDLITSDRYLQEKVVPVLSSTESKSQTYISCPDFTTDEKFVSSDDITSCIDKWITGKIHPKMAASIVSQVDTLVAKTSLCVTTSNSQDGTTSAKNKVIFTSETLLVVFNEELSPEYMRLLN